MTTKTTSNAIIEQFNRLIESSLASEYKDVLTAFKEQGEFYQQFVNEAQKSTPDLASFWNIPNTLGFQTNTHPVFDCFQGTTSSAGPLPASMAKLFEQCLNTSQKTQESITAFQAALSTLSTIHADIGQQAMHDFLQLKEQSPTPPSNETLCQFWLKAGEAAFKKASQQPNYLEAQQALYLSFSQLKMVQHSFFSQLSQFLGLPSQQTIDELHENLHQLRMQFAEHQEQTASTIHALKQSIDALQKQQ